MKIWRKSHTILALVIVSLLIASCATSPTGRHQLLALSSAELDQMGYQAYDQIKAETPISKDVKKTAYIQCIANHIIAVSGSTIEWETNLFDDDAVNAFALPGGKIGIYTGLLKAAVNQHQVAAVMGHEVGHVLAEHSNERMSIEVISNLGLQVASIFTGNSAGGTAVMAALGVGAQVGVALPFSRKHETEADIIGLELMAKAGFDPRESVTLWQNMAQMGGGGTPEFMSTHPSHDTRIKDLQNHIPKIWHYYEEAQSKGKKPNCKI